MTPHHDAPIEYLTTRRFAWAVDEPVSTILRLHRSRAFIAAVPGGLGRGKRSLYAPEQVEEYRLRKVTAGAERDARPRDHALVSLFEAWCRLLPLDTVRRILRGLEYEASDEPAPEGLSVSAGAGQPSSPGTTAPR